MNKKRLVAINFDLDTKKLKEIYVPTTGKKYNKSYYDIKAFMKENGFLHRQGSGYISREPMTEYTAALAIKKMGNSMPWLKECIRRIDLTVVGNQFDLTEVLNWKSGSKREKVQNIPERKASIEHPKEKNNTDIEEKYKTLSQSYAELLKANQKKEDLIHTTNQIFKLNPQLAKEFTIAKEKYLQQQAEQEKTKGGLNDKSDKNKTFEKKKNKLKL